MFLGASRCLKNLSSRLRNLFYKAVFRQRDRVFRCNLRTKKRQNIPLQYIPCFHILNRVFCCSFFCKGFTLQPLSQPAPNFPVSRFIVSGESLPAYFYSSARFKGVYFMIIHRFTVSRGKIEFPGIGGVQ